MTYGFFTGKHHTQSSKDKIRGTKLSGVKWYPKEFIASSTYKTWGQMKNRCENTNNPSYKNYGGRGIAIPKEWKYFAGFLRDMGEKPTGTSIERIDNNKGYSKENCRWANPKEQANNRRSCHFITWNGLTKNLTQWAEYLGIKRSTMMQRYFTYNWTIEKCLNFKR